VGDVVHAEIGDSESSTLILLRLELSISCLLGQCLSLGRDRCKTLRSDIFDYRRNKTAGGGNGNGYIGLLVPTINECELASETIKATCSHPNGLAQPS
jgi:hypothetical protein